jgi:hypothetical protein
VDESLITAIVSIATKNEFGLRSEALRLTFRLFEATHEDKILHFGPWFRIISQLSLEIPELFAQFLNFSVDLLEIDQSFVYICDQSIISLLFSAVRHENCTAPTLKLLKCLVEFHFDLIKSFLIGENSDLLFLWTLDSSTISLRILEIRYLTSLAVRHFPFSAKILAIISEKVTPIWGSKISELLTSSWELARVLVLNYAEFVEVVDVGRCLEAAVVVFLSESGFLVKKCASLVAMRVMELSGEEMICVSPKVREEVEKMYNELKESGIVEE